MNKLFGFFKQKIIQAKEQNKQEINTLAQALNETEYSKEKVLGLLQSAKANYMSWNILIANEASTGLYYSQTHNRNICLRKIKENKDAKRHAEAQAMKLGHIKQTSQELRDISALNADWAKDMNQEIQGIYRYISRKKRQLQASEQFKQITHEQRQDQNKDQENNKDADMQNI